MEQITLKNSVLVVKKQHDFVAGNVPNRMRSSKSLCLAVQSIEYVGYYIQSKFFFFICFLLLFLLLKLFLLYF